MDKRTGNLTMTTTLLQRSRTVRRLPRRGYHLELPHIRVGEVLGHTLVGIGVSLGPFMNFEAVTARYVDVRLERKKEVLYAYHRAVKQADPAKAKEAPPAQAIKETSRTRKDIVFIRVSDAF